MLKEVDPKFLEQLQAGQDGLKGDIDQLRRLVTDLARSTAKTQQVQRVEKNIEQEGRSERVIGAFTRVDPLESVWSKSVTAASTTGSWASWESIDFSSVVPATASLIFCQARLKNALNGGDTEENYLGLEFREDSGKEGILIGFEYYLELVDDASPDIYLPVALPAPSGGSGEIRYREAKEDYDYEIKVYGYL